MSEKDKVEKLFEDWIASLNIGKDVNIEHRHGMYINALTHGMFWGFSGCYHSHVEAQAQEIERLKSAITHHMKEIGAWHLDGDTETSDLHSIESFVKHNQE